MTTTRAGLLAAPAKPSAAAPQPEHLRRRAPETPPHTGHASTLVHDVLRQPGQPLDPPTRSVTGTLFRHDFSRVRVHTDEAAGRSAQEVGAAAYTVGADIVFAQGRYLPGTPHGDLLLAHELVHTVQQRHVTGTTRTLELGSSSAPQELAAERAVERLANGDSRTAPGELGCDDRPVLRRSFLSAIGGFFKGVAGFVTGVFSSLGHGIFGWSDDALSAYVALLEKTNLIEGDPDSDDKARALVKRWMEDRSRFKLSANVKRLLVLELLDGPTTESDEEAIVDLLETASDQDAAVILGPQGASPQQLQSDVDNEKPKGRLQRFFARRFQGGLQGVLKGDRKTKPYLNLKSMTDDEATSFVDRLFPQSQRPMARKILLDLRAVSLGGVDFDNEEELRTEITKRIWTSQLMKESQAGKAFDYPESATPANCPDFDSRGWQFNARVNKAARRFWEGPRFDEPYYYFRLTQEGKDNGYDALVTLFTEQPNFCDRTLIHCDYLTSVIQLRALAETVGRTEFENRIRTGAIVFRLTYYGADFIIRGNQSPRGGPTIGKPASTKSMSLQVVRPASEQDLVIGDKVLFWNHLAYDALSDKIGGPWRQENAVLVDKDSSGKDLFEGHGAPSAMGTVAPGPKEAILGELLTQFNRVAEPAIDLTRQVDEGYPNARANLTNRYPYVDKQRDQWIVNEKQPYRPVRSYRLRQLTSTEDPELLGLRDELDPRQMGKVERPLESSEEPLPTP